MKWAFCDGPLAAILVKTGANTACLRDHIMGEACQKFYLLVWEAHGCIKQRSILLIAQGAGRAARISIFAATNKPAALN